SKPTAYPPPLIRCFLPRRFFPVASDRNQCSASPLSLSLCLSVKDLFICPLFFLEFEIASVDRRGKRLWEIGHGFLSRLIGSAFLFRWDLPSL
ncbi:unnamed protein product, partial [Musa hybrid cultivar]